MQHLKSLRKSRGVTQKQLADYLGCTEQSVANYENGRRSADYETQLKISEFFGVPLDYLFRGSESSFCDVPGIMSMPQMFKKPLLGTISCGDPIMSEENFEGYYDVPEMFSGCDFILKCEGDSMTGARIYDGDFVFIKQQSIVDNGQIAAILIDGTEKLLKRVYITDESVILQAENPAYPPRVFSKDDMNRVSIIGKAIGYASVIR